MLHQWFDWQKVYLHSLKSQLKGLVKAMEVVMKAQTDIIGKTTNLLFLLEKARKAGISGEKHSNPNSMPNAFPAWSSR